MNETSPRKDRSWFAEMGCRVSSWVADVAGHPFAQIAVVVVCAAWFLGGFGTDLLTAILSILAITLSQMVLNNQQEREIDAHRRDVAMHAKLDELIAASKRARNDLVGVEDREEDEIVQLKEEVKAAIDDGDADAAASQARAAARDAGRPRVKASTTPRA
jgi:low affinity Fe/Cu permease